MLTIEDRQEMTPSEVAALAALAGGAITAGPAYFLLRSSRGKAEADSYKSRADGTSVLVLASEEAVDTIRGLLVDLRSEVETAKTRADAAERAATETKAELRSVTAALATETARCNRLEARVLELEHDAAAREVRVTALEETAADK